ncbi:MAG: transposase [Myxococcales bacterium]|nr:transposase [Myxococcales bacterium]
MGFVTLVYDLRGNRVVHVADGRSREALESFFLTIEPHQLARIDAMAMDMAAPYIAAATEALPEPESTIVFDRFHVMKAMNQAVDEVRGYLECRTSATLESSPGRRRLRRGRLNARHPGLADPSEALRPDTGQAEATHFPLAPSPAPLAR